MVGGGRSICLGEPCAQTGRPETTPPSEVKTEPPSAPAGPATRLMAADQATWAKQQRCAGLSWPPRQDFAERVPELERRPSARRPAAVCQAAIGAGDARAEVEGRYSGRVSAESRTDVAAAETLTLTAEVVRSRAAAEGNDAQRPG